MNSNPSKIPFFLICTLLAAFLIPSLACSVGGLTVSKDSATVDITLQQDQVNELLKSFERAQKMARQLKRTQKRLNRLKK